VARIFARWAIATFANICIQTQDGARLPSRTPRRTCKERWQAGVLCNRANPRSTPSIAAFTVFLTKWCEEPVTVGSRGPQ
jgi:hypothetical protein